MFFSITADHHWPLMDNGRDEFQLYDLYPSNQKSFTGFDLETGKAHARTYDIDKEDCLVNPDRCGDGMAVQFSINGKSN